MEKELEKYLNGEGIINYTNSILDEYKLGGAVVWKHIYKKKIFGIRFKHLSHYEDEGNTLVI